MKWGARRASRTMAAVLTLCALGLSSAELRATDRHLIGLFGEASQMVVDASGNFFASGANGDLASATSLTRDHCEHGHCASVEPIFRSIPSSPVCERLLDQPERTPCSISDSPGLRPPIG